MQFTYVCTTDNNTTIIYTINEQLDYIQKIIQQIQMNKFIYRSPQHQYKHCILQDNVKQKLHKIKQKKLVKKERNLAPIPKQAFEDRYRILEIKQMSYFLANILQKIFLRHAIIIERKNNGTFWQVNFRHTYIIQQSLITTKLKGPTKNYILTKILLQQVNETPLYQYLFSGFDSQYLHTIQIREQQIRRIRHLQLLYCHANQLSQSYNPYTKK
eukprot:TRINITY_DN1926_c0_g1_i2.p2 TRINITY_DN1926_c0_g1~~TRINITY_DN1926_c0_g1_i2.p2  ORF type:complete len:214 (-),score=-4.51 TRINITY_DN1926_c0_g1_i2:102-743(-)